MTRPALSAMSRAEVVQALREAVARGITEPELAVSDAMDRLVPALRKRAIRIYGEAFGITRPN